MVTATVRDTLDIIQYCAKVFRRRSLLARKIEAAMRALRLVYQQDLLAELNGRAQLELMRTKARAEVIQVGERCSGPQR